jgi:hypothetical protein
MGALQEERGHLRSRSGGGVIERLAVSCCTERLWTSQENNMPTIVSYTDQKPSKNEYPKRIVSPSRPGPCCFSDMAEVGKAMEEGRWVFQYRRCRTCGFTVRVILREIPDPDLVKELRRTLLTSFVRNVPDL